MKKKCLIYASLPITCFEVPIIGHVELNLTSDEIYKCLCSKAQVVEILPNGKKINLDFSNYNKSNIEKPKVEITKKELVEEQTSEEVIVLEDTVKVEEKIIEDLEDKKEDSAVKTYELSSRNNNYNNKQQYNKNRKNKNKR